jgi:predicted nucleotidyltransferase
MAKSFSSVTRQRKERIVEGDVSQQATIDEITRRLVDFYRPVRIYLFGSQARGDAGLDSDLDFCVILPDDASPALYNAEGVH